MVFWQQRAHYFEERARVQGTNATQTVTVSIATLVLGTVPIAFQLASPSPSTGQSPPGWSEMLPYFLIAVPLIALLLWMTSLRFLTEMFRLDVYYMRADSQVRQLRSKPQPGVLTYRTWAEGGGSEARWWGYLAWFVLALLIQGFAIWLYLELFKLSTGDALLQLLSSDMGLLIIALASLAFASIAAILIVWECVVAWTRNWRVARELR